MKKAKGTKGIVIIIILAVLIVFYYAYLSNRTDRKKQAEEEYASVEVMTPVQEVLSRNLETNYPATPREVVKYFSDITQCFYNEEYTEEELYDLAMKIRGIYDDELVQNQTEEEYLIELKEDINEFKELERTIASYTPSSTIDVETFTQDGYEWARLYCIYSIKQEVLINSNIQFLLRRDENDHYKIYGWQLAVDNDKEEATPAESVQE